MGSSVTFPTCIISLVQERKVQPQRNKPFRWDAHLTRSPPGTYITGLCYYRLQLSVWIQTKYEGITLNPNES